MLPGHGVGDLFRHPPRTQVYCIRPSRPEDQVRTLLILSLLIQSGFSQRTFALSDSAGAYFQGDERGERSCPRGTVAPPLSVVRGQFGSVFSGLNLNLLLFMVTFQPVDRWALPLPRVCSGPGGRPWTVRLCSGRHRCPTGRSQNSGGLMQIYWERAQIFGLRKSNQPLPVLSWNPSHSYRSRYI